MENSNQDIVAIATSLGFVRTGDGTARLWGSATSATAFTVLGARAMLGRTLVPSDEGNPDIVVLSFATWRRLFHSDLAMQISRLNRKH